MKVIKFGGTSLGSPERMKKVAELVSKEEAIVVLSAISGTTNSLTEIAQLLYKNERNTAKQKITELQASYVIFIDNLLQEKAQQTKAIDLVSSHFSHIDSFTEDLFTVHEEKMILAQANYYPQPYSNCIWRN